MAADTPVVSCYQAGRDGFWIHRQRAELGIENHVRDKPAVQPVPLPPPGQYYPRSGGLNLHLDVDLDFSALNQRLSDTLAGKPLLIKGREAGINELELAGSGQAMEARMELTGELAGTAELHAEIAYNAQDRKHELQDLTFDYDPQDPTLGVLEEAFHEPIRMALEEAANQALAQQLELLGQRLRAVLKKIMPSGVALDLSALQLRSVQIVIEQRGIRLEGTASGNVQLAFR